MRILVHDYAGHPFQAQLSRELARRGHTVAHVYCASYTSGKGAVSLRTDDPASLQFTGLRLGSEFAKHSIFKRLNQEMAYGRLLTSYAKVFEPDVVLSANTPLFTQRQLQGWAHRHGVRITYWLQDLISVAMSRELTRRLGVAGRPGGMILGAIERDLLRSADHVVAITTGFLPILAKYGVSRSRVSVIPNWAPLDEIEPRPRSNAWSQANGLDDRVVFLYAGTLGLKHDPDLLVALAAGVPEAQLVVVSEGRGADHIRDSASRQGLDNVRVLPFQPYDQLPNVLASGDVLVVILERDAGEFSVPSKVLSYLCAGRTVLGAMPTQNLATRTVRDAGAGATVAPDDKQAFVNAARALAHDADARARNGESARRYAERTFDIAHLTDQFELALEPSHPIHEGKIANVAHAA